MGNFKNIVGKRFWHYEVISREPNSTDACGTVRSNWRVKCLLCGHIETIKARYLQRGTRPTCECKNMPIAQKEKLIKQLAS